MPLLLLGKSIRLWLPDLDSQNKKYILLQTLLYTPFLVLYAIGICQCARRSRMRTLPWLAFHGTVLATVFTALVFWGAPRFRDVNLGPLMAYAAVGATTLRSRWKAALPQEVHARLEVS
jgi:hypothetical protein